MGTSSLEANFYKIDIMTLYNKLIRDNIIEHIETKGGTARYHIADEVEYKEKLLLKLQEEVVEFIEAKNQEEMADIFEVITAILKHYSWSLEDIVAVQKEKREKKGAFTKRIILEES
jgi:predicted house-cleaning noncanonical NTP pyrophosphatase (MazG superfamily)